MIGTQAGYSTSPMSFQNDIMTGIWQSISSWASQTNLEQFRLKSLVTLPLVISTLASLDPENRPFDVLKYVDPLIGTINGG